MENSTNIINTEEILYDEERYLDLDSEEEKLNEMSEDEREIYLEIKRERKQKEKEKQEQEQEKKDDDMKSDDSIDIEKPSTDQQRKIIEKTAKFITESSNPQMEIVIQAKQSSNPLFNFLNKNDILYPYYRRICLLMRMGIYTYSEEEELINANENKNDENNKKNEEKNEENENKKEMINNEDIKISNKDINIKKNGNNLKNDLKNDEEIQYKELEKKIPNNTIIIIEKMANYIARNGSEFETLVRQKNIGDERFSFMQPWNEFYGYYKYRISKCLITNNNQNSISSYKENDDNDKICNNNENFTEVKSKINNSNEINSNKSQNSPKEILDLNEESENMKEIKAKRLLKMKEIIARKKLKKN